MPKRNRDAVRAGRRIRSNRHRVGLRSKEELRHLAVAFAQPEMPAVPEAVVPDPEVPPVPPPARPAAGPFGSGPQSNRRSPQAAIRRKLRHLESIVARLEASNGEVHPLTFDKIAFLQKRLKELGD